MSEYLNPESESLPPPESPGEVLAASMRVAETGVEASRELIVRMLECADDVLFEMSEQSDSDASRRNYFDAMRMLRKSAESLLDDFAETIRTEAPEPSPDEFPKISLEDLEVRHEDEVEAEIMAGNVVSRVESAASNELWEFQLRTEHLPEKTSLRTALERLSPKSVATTFKNCLAPHQLPVDVRLIVFKLFERQFVTDARLFYQSLNRELGGVGQSLDEVLARRAPGERRPPYERNKPPAPMFSVSNEIIDDLNKLRAAGSAESPMFSAGHLQRISLLSQWFDEAGSHWPEKTRSSLHELLGPMAGIALSDSQFFTDQRHPARELLKQLDLGDCKDEEVTEAIPRVRSQLEQMDSQKDIPSHVELLPPSALEMFLQDQRKVQQKTEQRLEVAREQARAQIRKLGSGVDLPAGIAKFLQSIWVPMGSAIYMRFGEESEQWRSAEKLLSRLFGASRWARGPGLVDAVVDELLNVMTNLGLPEELSTRAIRLLREGLSKKPQKDLLLDLETLGERQKEAKLKSDASTSPQSRNAERIGSLSDWRTALPFGHWFRVYDRATDRTVWMSAGVFYPESKGLQFTGFDPTARVKITKIEFLSDIKIGRAEAVSPTPAQVDALQRLTASLDG